MTTTDIQELQAPEERGGSEILASDNPKPFGSSDLKVTHMLQLNSSWKAYQVVMCDQELDQCCGLDICLSFLQNIFLSKPSVLSVICR